MRCNGAYFLFMVLLAMWSSLSHSAEIDVSGSEVLFADNFEDRDAKGWQFDGRGSNRVTVYSGNHSLNLSRSRAAQISVPVEGFNRVEMTMQLAAMTLAAGESCNAEISTNGGQRWQSLLKVTPPMADGITLHTKTGRIANPGSITNLKLRFRADGGRKANCWGDNVEVIGIRDD
ncbi:MAG: hypothetical protein VYE04_10810 [Pseudomonadota bacterium]|nr:hypothetical protein [Pseudomonadota bacterium]